MKKLVLTGLLACLASPVVFAQEPTPIFDVAKARTVDEWSLLIQGKLNRSAVVKLLGKPDKAFSGALFYNNKVKDADTDDLYVLNILFGHGEKLPATYVGYTHNPDLSKSSSSN